MTLVLAFLAMIEAHAAGPVGPAVVVKQVAPPEVLVSGVKTLQVKPFDGTTVDIAAQIKLALANKDRMRTDAAAVGKEALAMGTDLAAQYVGGLVGGGIQGQIVQGLTKNTVQAVADELEAEPLILQDGLTIDVFQVVDGAADASLGGTVAISDALERYTVKQQAVDGDGNGVVDAEGKPVMVDVACVRRNVDVKVDWVIRGGAGGTGSVTRQGADSRCGDDQGQLAEATAIAEPLLQDLGDTIVRDFAPSWRIRRLALNQTKVAKDAMKFVRQSDWKNALCAFSSVAAANPDDSDALFDHGVLLEAFGHHDAAQKRYAEANAVKAKKPYEKAAERAVERATEVSNLTATYGLTWTVPAEPTCP